MKKLFWAMAIAMMASFGFANGTAVIEITSDDAMRYNITSFEVKSGQKVKLVLKHIGKFDVNTMGHNVVILTKGTDLNQFAVGIMANGGTPENGYLPTKTKDQILVATDMIGGGQETTVEFTAPEPGEYPFLCTFPGHFGLMQGKMIVK